jgi:xanthine dehydrogenase accessory factor
MITPEGEQIGTFPGHETVLTALVEQFDDIMEKQRPDIITYTDSEGRETDVLAEPVFADPALYIFGGGHVSTEIVPLAARAGFKVVVIDDREEYAAPDRFPQAAKVQCRPFAGVLKKLDIDHTSYIVIVTRGHMHDKTILEQSLKTDAKYIGMIGSRRKRDMIYDKLLEEGFTQDDLGRICSPIGLDIGAETPEEIAVSIAAELIKVRAGKG